VFVFSNWLNKEEISSLIKSEGILECSIDAEDTKKYFVVSENPKYRQCVKFFLCDIRQEKYLSENITVWHNVECYVYQMQIGDKMIVSIDDANKNVWYGNLCHFFWMFPILIPLTLYCLLALSYLNNHYRNEILE
jgi:hypothetical protein